MLTCTDLIEPIQGRKHLYLKRYTFRILITVAVILFLNFLISLELKAYWLSNTLREIEITINVV